MSTIAENTLRRDWLLTLKNVFLPIFCKECGVRLETEENKFFCPDCWEGSPRIERPFCSRCGKPHPPQVGLGGAANFPCADCREKPNKYIGRIYGAAYYDGAVARAVKLLKFQDREGLAEPLAELAAAFAADEMDAGAYDVIVPVPLHKVRERARGFNQSRLLATHLLSAFPKAALDESLERIRPTRTQSRLEATERLANVRGAFAVRGEGCAGKKVLLVDDVVTSSGTVTECARVLRRAGAAEVDVLAAALAVSRYEA